jgi:hypothetical protein
MALTLRPGQRLLSNVCETEMITVKAPTGSVALTIGGVTPATSASERTTSGLVVDGHNAGSSIGKRYVDETESVQLLCTKSGDGVPAIDGELLTVKEAKALPSSD